MERLRSSTKRAHSATPPPEDSSNLPQTDGACLGKPDGAEDAVPAAKAAKSDSGAEAAPAAAAAAPVEQGPPEMPQFLQLSDGGKLHLT